MEAKVIKTGEIIDVIPFNYVNDTPIYSDGNGRTFSGKEIILDGQKSIMELWIARNKDNSLFIYYLLCPTRIDDIFLGLPNREYCLKIDSDSFPEVTWENSPQLVELKLK